MARGAALLLRFSLLFFLARALEPSEVGLFGLLAATVLYVAGVAGLGYSMWSTREIAATEGSRRTATVRDQAVFGGLAYVVVLPLSMLLFVAGALPWSLLAWFYPLLVLEHAGLEAERILVAASRQSTASAVLFLRNSAWVLVIVPLMWTDARYRTVETVFAGWAAGAGVACAVGIAGVARIGSWDFARAVDWDAMKAGLRIGLPLLGGTLALKAVTTIDRMWVNAIGGLEVLGPYVLFIGIANVAKAFLNSSVFPFCYPQLVRAVAVGDGTAFRAGMRSMTWQAAAVTAVVVLASLSLIEPLLRWIGRPIYAAHVVLFYWSLTAVALYAAAQVFQSGIYAWRMDHRIVAGQFAGLAAFVAAASALGGLVGVQAVPIALCAAYAVMLAFNVGGMARLPAAARGAR